MTAAAIYALMVGEIGISHTSLMHDMKHWQISSTITAYRRRHHQLWESTRWQTYILLSALGSKVNTPQDLLPLPWDTVSTSSYITDEEFLSLQSAMSALNSQPDHTATPSN